MIESKGRSIVRDKEAPFALNEIYAFKNLTRGTKDQARLEIHYSAENFNKIKYNKL